MHTALSHKPQRLPFWRQSRSESAEDSISDLCYAQQFETAEMQSSRTAYGT